jgi:predicted ribosome quality control (RQC) complex YloA/Tae2 family protein
MSLDGAFLHIVKTEMVYEGLINSRVEKIHQPSREEIILSLHTKNGNKKLLLSANPASARVCLTSRVIDNPPLPPMFCQLLRKKIGGGRLTEIVQDGFERVIFFKFNCRNEIGDEENITLSVEIMGRSNNIVLLIEKDKQLCVIEALRRINDHEKSDRRVLPGLIYELPPREERLSLLNFTKGELMNALKNHENNKLNKALIKIFEGICPLFAREAAFRASGDTDIMVSDVNINQLIEFLNTAVNPPNPVMLTDKDKKPIDFTFTEIKQYGGEVTIIPYDSANNLLDNFYNKRAETERIRQRSGAMLKTLNNRYERVLRKIDLRHTELSACAGRDIFRKYGDIISANIYAMQKGMDKLTAADFETGEEITIPLDVRKSPSQNAQKYYAEYKKMQNAEKTLIMLIKDGEDELKYLDSVLEAAERANSDSELLEIKRELIETGYIKSQVSKKNPKQEKPGEPLKFISSDGMNILVGRNNRQNDILTLKIAKPHEIWLHTKDIAGSHVIIRSEKPSEKTLTEAAELAAWFSKAQTSSRVPVDYTEVRYVKKPSGAKPGMVIFTNNKTLYVTPSEEIYNKLKV